MKQVLYPSKALIAVCVLVSCAHCVRSEDVATPTSTSDRPRLTLDGNWDFRYRPEARGRG